MKEYKLKKEDLIKLVELKGILWYNTFTLFSIY